MQDAQESRKAGPTGWRQRRSEMWHSFLSIKETTGGEAKAATFRRENSPSGLQSRNMSQQGLGTRVRLCRCTPHRQFGVSLHMMHSCRCSGASACGLVKEGNKRPAWRYTLLPGSTFVLNKYFHSVVRNSIA